MSKKRSAPGLDQIDYSIIVNLPEEELTQLLSLYNLILEQGVLPDSWKDSLVVLIPKPGGESVRPIALLSCFAKIMEYMIYFRLRWFIESRPILPQTQSGSAQLDPAWTISSSSLPISELVTLRNIPLLQCFWTLRELLIMSTPISLSKTC